MFAGFCKCSSTCGRRSSVTCPYPSSISCQSLLSIVSSRCSSLLACYKSFSFSLSRRFSFYSAMWSSGQEDGSSNRYTSSSSSKSSSTSSYSATFSPSSLFIPPSGKKTLEEVWKDINLRSLQDPLPPRREEAGAKSSDRRTILQDFLARPFGEQESSKAVLVASNPPPATAFSLNSGPEFQYLDSPGLSHSNTFKNFYGGNTSSGNPFEVMESSLSKRRMTEPEDKCVDRKYKRMIKNRESAARSRARKQAYTNELEHEVANLMEENAKLRKQQQQLQVRLAASARLSWRHNLSRTSTAPF